jgi:MFS family permease
VQLQERPWALRRLVPSAYRPVLVNRVFRRLILGFAVSYLGDGMSFVAVAWLAIELAPQASAGLWVGGAVAAYTLPGVVGALVFGRRLRRVTPRRLLLVDSLVRGVFLGAVPLSWFAGLLTPSLYVVLLAGSSLLHAWGSAGKYTLLAELLPGEQRLAANTLVSSVNFAATIAGAAIAGVMVTYVSSALVLGLDALTYVFLALLVVRTRLPESGHVSPVDRIAARGGFALLRSYPELLGLLSLTWFFNLLYGPVEVALPLHVTEDLHAPGTLLGLYWTLFGVGAVIGGLAVGALRQLPLWPVTVAIVIGWGLTLLPFGLDMPAPVTVACFTLGGVIYGPFVALSVTLMQAKSPPEHLAAMLAARSAALLTASPLGTALGGPLTTALGPRATLGGSGLATVVLGVVAAILLLVRRRNEGMLYRQTDQESRSAGHGAAASMATQERRSPMAMQARISTIEGDGSKLDDALEVINGKVLPALKALEGFTAVNFLVDRSAGKLVAVAFYADEAALEGSVDAVGPMRDEVADAMGGKVVGVESYELVAQSW